MKTARFVASPMRSGFRILLRLAWLAAFCCPAGWVQATPYSDAVLADAPLAYWRLGEASGPTVSDATGNGHSGTADAGVIFATNGLLTKAAETGDTAVTILNNDTITAPGFEKYPGGATGFTVEFWVKLHSAPTGFHNLVGDGESGNDLYLMVYISNTRRIRAHFDGKSPQSVESITALEVGETYHVVVTWESASGQAAIYINGTLNKSALTSTGPPANSDNAVYLGDDPREAGAHLTLDEAAIYSRPLSSMEVKEHYRLGSAVALRDGPRSVSLSTHVLNEGSAVPDTYADNYNNNGTDSTVELIDFIANSASSPLNVAYNQSSDTIDVAQFVVGGASRGASQGMKSNGYTTGSGFPTDLLYLKGETAEGHEGFGAHANWLITFDLTDIRTVHFAGVGGTWQLTGKFGIWGGAGSPVEAQGVIWLDGVRIDSMPEATAAPVLNPGFDLEFKTSAGRWLTFGIFNGDGTGDNTIFDDAAFEDVTLTLIPHRGTVIFIQ